VSRPKLFLVPVDTLRGNRAHEWSSTTGKLPVRPQADKRAFWDWLSRLAEITREAARTGSQVRPGGRAGW